MLSKTIALVTGGSSGLGAAAASSLICQGARVCVIDLEAQKDRFLQWARKSDVPIIDGGSHDSTSGPALVFAATDVTNPDEVNDALTLVEHVYGEPINVAINCAGIAPARKTLSKRGPHPLEEFTKAIMVNTVGTFNVGRLAAERMSTREADSDGLRGCIINTASIAAYDGQIGQVAYAASKGGVVGMTLPMARDLASSGIRVMTIAPGLFETPLLDGLPQQVKNELGSSVPCPSRLGKPSEYGQLVVQILENSMLNGSVIRLDGALRMPP